MNWSLWTWSVVIMVCYERGLLWTWSVLNGLFWAVCYEQVCFERSPYFAMWGKITAGDILPLAEHDWLK